MMDLLALPREPWLLEMVDTPEYAYEYGWGQAAGGKTVRMLRGQRMTTATALFREIGAALQFPPYFGENWPALHECLSDLSWLPGSAYLIVCVDSSSVLDEERDEFRAFLRALTSAAEIWSKAVDLGEAWDRPATPFHIVFQVEPRNSEILRNRVAASGFALHSLTS